MIGVLKSSMVSFNSCSEISSWGSPMVIGISLEGFCTSFRFRLKEGLLIETWFSFVLILVSSNTSPDCF
jgi:hypothetical protein